MAMDDDIRRHVDTWQGFARLLRWSVIGIVLTLLLLAFFLL